MSLRCDNCRYAKRQCPDCVKVANKIRMQGEHYKAVKKEADKRYNQTEARKESRERHHQKRCQTKEYKQAKRGYDTKNRELHPERHKARAYLNAIVSKGKLPPASSLPCKDCGQSAAEYHHESYERDKWLDVIPLCKPCHTSRHPRS